MSEIDLSNVNRLYTVLLLEAEERHGYQIIKDIEEITGNKPTTSHIYPFLEELREKELVTVEKKGERGKKIYRLTEEGEQLVRDQIDSFGQMLHAAIKDQIEECSHCDCKIYDDGFEKEGRIYCCEHCASADET